MNFWLKDFYEKNHWKEQNYFSNFNHDSEQILNFNIPSNSLDISFGKSISPHFKSYFSIGLPMKRSISFLFCSNQLEMINNLDLINEPMKQKVSWKQDTNLNEFMDLVRSSPKKTNDYLLFGKICENLHLEALYSQFFGLNTLFVVSGISILKPETGHLNLQLFKKSNHFLSELVYTSDDDTFGLSTVYNLPKTSWSFGGEVFYTGSIKRSGAFSLAARYRNIELNQSKSVFTVMTNPVFGHFSSSYTRNLSKNVIMSTQYDLNAYSFESDICVGLQTVPLNQDICMKVNMSTREGIALMFQGQYKRALLSFGLMTGFSKGPGRFGIEIQVN